MIARLIVATALALAACNSPDEQPARSPEEIARDLDSATSNLPPPGRRRDPSLPLYPGVKRVGIEKAEQLFRDITSIPGFLGYECQGDQCFVGFSPPYWERMTTDERRELVTSIGIALGHGLSARVTIVQRHNEEEYGRYVATIDRASLK